MENLDTSRRLFDSNRSHQLRSKATLCRPLTQRQPEDLSPDDSPNHISSTSKDDILLSVIKPPVPPAPSPQPFSDASLPSIEHPSTEGADAPVPLVSRDPKSYYASHLTYYSAPSAPESFPTSHLSTLSESSPRQYSYSTTQHLHLNDPGLTLLQLQALPKHPSSTSSPSIPVNMSTALGIQFDQRFDPVNKSSYSSWPVFDLDEPYLGSFGVSMDIFNEVSHDTMYARSYSTPPPIMTFSPEQRELKRQLDMSRKGCKSRVRRERSSSSPYASSPASTSDMTTDIISSYATPLGAVSLPAEPLLPSITSNPYLAHSAMPSPQSPDLCPTAFTLMSDEFAMGSFMMPFSSSNMEQPVPTYASHQHPSPTRSENPYFYRAASIMGQETHENVRVVNSRPKPQCWEHGCSGRQFSTFSNLLRHQREKSGVTSKPSCPKCGAEFTRTTARNGHMAHEKCKQRRNS